MTHNANEVCRAFITAFSEDNGYVVFRQRGGVPGYVHIIPSGFDPELRDNRHLAVELANGTVSVTEELQHIVQAHARPDVHISKDDLGWSAGPNSGRFKWALRYQEICAKPGGIDALAKVVAAHYRALTPRKK